MRGLDKDVNETFHSSLANTDGFQISKFGSIWILWKEVSDSK